MLLFILIKQPKEETRSGVQMYTSLGPMMRMNTKTYPLMTLKSFNKRMFPVSLLNPRATQCSRALPRIIHIQHPEDLPSQTYLEKLSNDQQQMIIDHNRSLPKSGSSSLSTPNKSPSPLPHKPTPQQTAKSQQVHTHQSDRALLTQPKLKPLLLTLYWQWYISPFTPLRMMLQTSPRFFQPRGLDRSKHVTLHLPACQSHQHSVGGPWCQWRPCWFRHASHLQNPPQDQHFRH